MQKEVQAKLLQTRSRLYLFSSVSACKITRSKRHAILWPALHVAVFRAAEVCGFSTVESVPQE
jgi:hypothetical protein